MSTTKYEWTGPTGNNPLVGDVKNGQVLDNLSDQMVKRFSEAGLIREVKVEKARQVNAEEETRVFEGEEEIKTLKKKKTKD